MTYMYLTLPTITVHVLPLTTVYFVSEIHCTSNVHVLHSITPLVLCYHVHVHVEM